MFGDQETLNESKRIFLGAEVLKICQEGSSIVEDDSKEANSSELFPILLLLSKHSGDSASANCCNI